MHHLQRNECTISNGHDAPRPAVNAHHLPRCIQVLSILALIAAACGLFACTIGGDPASGIRVLIVAALISPFGLPALSEWLILKLGDLKYALRAI